MANKQSLYPASNLRNFKEHSVSVNRQHFFISVGNFGTQYQPILDDFLFRKRTSAFSGPKEEWL